MPLPTMSLRASPEHHQLIRDIATALRTRPELADVLRDVLQAQHGGVAERDTDVLQPILERLTREEEFSRRIMAFAENINERVKALEQPPEPEIIPVTPRQSQAAAAGKRRSRKQVT
jgi:hypothetical protein